MVTCVCVGKLGVEVLIWRLRRRKLLLQTESRHQLLKEDARPITVPAETAHDVIGRATCKQRERGKERERPWIGKRVTQSNISIKQQFGINLYGLCKHWRQGVCTTTDLRLWSTGRTVPRWQTAAQRVWWTDSSTDRRPDLQSPLCPTLTETERYKDRRDFTKLKVYRHNYAPLWLQCSVHTSKQTVSLNVKFVNWETAVDSTDLYSLEHIHVYTCSTCSTSSKLSWIEANLWFNIGISKSSGSCCFRSRYNSNCIQLEAVVLVIRHISCISSSSGSKDRTNSSSRCRDSSISGSSTAVRVVQFISTCIRKL